MRTSSYAAILVTLLAWHPRTLAGEKIIEKGTTVNLGEDIVLADDDVLEFRGTEKEPIILRANKLRIFSTPTWKGRFKFTHVQVSDLGHVTAVGERLGPEQYSIQLTATGEASVTIEHCDFRTSAAIRLVNQGRSTATFRGNTIHEDAIVPVSKDIFFSRPSFEAAGDSQGKKLFQANRIYKSNVSIQSPGWLVGGDSDADSNLVIGHRAGIFVGGEGSVVRGNYVHVLMPLNEQFPYWSQVSTFTTSKGALGEHNVIRDGEWIVRFVEGEFRFNLICDINDHDLMQQGSTARIHHNVFFAGQPDHPPGSMFACIAVIYPPKKPGEGAEIFNNTFDGCGLLDVPAVEVAPGAFVKSLRNNAMVNFVHGRYGKTGAAAMVRPAWQDEFTGPQPDRLGYSDYNLFHSPKSKVTKNYLLSVTGKTERKDAGFAKHDLPAEGAVDGQVEPKFAGPLVTKFPFEDADIKQGKVTVSQILARYRAMYRPGEGSLLIGSGDPADGKGSYIGAVGPGDDAPGDSFGKFGAKK